MVDTATKPEQTTDPGLTGLSDRARLWLLTVACMGVLLVISSMVALNTAMGDLATETSASQTELTWVIDGYTLVLACLLLPAGALGDRYGRRGALLVGLAIFTVASIAPLIYDSPSQLIVARAVAGAGAAFVMPATLSLLTAAYPKAERNKAVGIWAGVAGSGAVVGFLGSGVLLHFWSWQSIFWAFAICGAGIFVLACTVATSGDENSAPLDVTGSVLIGSAVAVFVFGVLQAPADGWSHPLVYGCMAVGTALAVAFALVQLRRRHPLLDVRLFKSPDFATGATGVTFLFFANFGFFFVSIQYMQLVMGYNPLQTAFALVPLALPVLLLGATTHLFLPRIGLRVAASVGLLLISTGLLCMRLLQIDSTYFDLAWPLLVMSTGIGLCTAPTTAAIMGAVPDGKQGVASAVNDATREIGAALGIAVAGSMLAAQYRDILMSELDAFPGPVHEAAADSLAGALAVSEHLGPRGAVLAELAQSAFLESFHTSLLGLALVLAVAAVFIGIWSPGRDGRQLRVVRKLTERPSAPGRHRLTNSAAR